MSERSPAEGSEQSEGQGIELTEYDAPEEQAVEKKREQIRGNVTGWLLAALFLLLIGGIVAVFSGAETWNRYEELARLAVPAVIGLLGSAIGFYFGSQR